MEIMLDPLRTPFSACYRSAVSGCLLSANNTGLFGTKMVYWNDWSSRHRLVPQVDDAHAGAICCD